MFVRELMTPRVISVQPGDSLETARQELQDNRIHHLLVMEHGKIVGIVSYRDLIRGNNATRVSEVMSRDVLTVRPTDTIRSAAASMLGRTHGCLPVVEGHTVTGVITTTDLLRGVAVSKPPAA